ncbi:MAG: shikimate dehydrogenase [Novosphingobium sp.]|nr:shikimate dehydrogenase [Novosphingobium sp.]
MSKPYAEVIGDPITHSKSPTIHGFWLKKLGIDAGYRAYHVRPGEIPDYCDMRRRDPDWRGCNVTIPHKEAIAPVCDTLEPATARLGAVNTVIRQVDGTLLGTNTDIDGIEAAIAGVELQGARVVVLGAGGAARAVFALLANKWCASVKVLARTPEKAERAARECKLKMKALPFTARSGAFKGADLVINATQLGMTGQQPMPAFVLEELKQLSPGALVFDMVYAPLETELLKAARDQGLRTSDGLVMLIGQAATAFERFFGQPPPRDCDDELRAMLTA